MNEKYESVGGASPRATTVRGKNIGIEMNGGELEGTVGVDSSDRIGIKMNGGNVQLTNKYGYGGINGKQGLIVNGGNITLDKMKIYSTETGLIVNHGLTINGSLTIDSGEGNGIEVNDGSNLNLSTVFLSIDAGNNCIYLNGGTISLGQYTHLDAKQGYEIYINKGINDTNKNDVLNLENGFMFDSYTPASSYYDETFYDLDIYVNPSNKIVKMSDKMKFLKLEGNRLKLNFCSNNPSVSNTNSTSGVKICESLGASYDGPIYSNELSCGTLVYINEEENAINTNCNSLVNNENDKGQQGPEIVDVPST